MRGGGLVGNGNLTLINQGTIHADGTSTNKTLNVQPASLTNSGTMQATGGGLLNISGLNPNSGTISSGVGSVVTINGTFSNTAAGTVVIAIAGTLSTQYGRLAISGSASLGGSLNLSSVGGFVPSIGNTFQVLAYGSSTGQFATVDGQNIGYTASYGPTALNLIVASVSAGPLFVPVAEPIVAIASDDSGPQIVSTSASSNLSLSVTSHYLSPIVWVSNSALRQSTKADGLAVPPTTVSYGTLLEIAPRRGGRLKFLQSLDLVFSQIGRRG